MSPSASSNLIPPEEEFQRHVLAQLDRAEEIIGKYRFRGMRSLIEDYGAVETAKRLLDPGSLGQPYDGFSVLADHDLLDCSLEQSVVTFAKSGLFHNSLVSSAKARLAIRARTNR